MIEFIIWWRRLRSELYRVSGDVSRKGHSVWQRHRKRKHGLTAWEQTEGLSPGIKWRFKNSELFWWLKLAGIKWIDYRLVLIVSKLIMEVSLSLLEWSRGGGGGVLPEHWEFRDPRPSGIWGWRGDLTHSSWSSGSLLTWM